VISEAPGALFPFVITKTRANTQFDCREPPGFCNHVLPLWYRAIAIEVTRRSQYHRPRRLRRCRRQVRRRLTDRALLHGIFAELVAERAGDAGPPAGNGHGLGVDRARPASSRAGWSLRREKKLAPAGEPGAGLLQPCNTPANTSVVLCGRHQAPGTSITRSQQTACATYNRP
jgi:hypothetical protein